MIKCSHTWPSSLGVHSPRYFLAQRAAYETWWTSTAEQDVIPKTAVKQFMARERRDVRPIKKLTNKQLSSMLKQLSVRPPIWNKLGKHQRACFLLGAQYGSFGFHLDTGMGKTLLGIALSRYYEKAGKLTGRRVLVLVPNKINKAEWRREFHKWGQKDRFIVLRGSTKEKWQQLRESNQLFIVETYGGFIRLACDLQPKKKGKRMVNALVPNKSKVKELSNLFGGMILDESTNVASRTALATRVCKQLKKTAAFLFEMTGTPFGRDPSMLHQQLQLIDGGYSLGETLGLFRAAFFTEKKNYWGGMDYTFKRDMEHKLNRFLAHSTIRYKVEQSDLPAYNEQVRVISLPMDAQVYAEKAMEILRKASSSYQATKNAFLRMRQISSGWIGYEDEDEGKRAQMEFEHNPKLDELLSLVETVSHKMIIFHEFVFSGSMICRELTNKGVGWARIGGKTTEHDSILKRFEREPGLRVLVLQNSMSFGPNLQAAKYGIWYEEPTSCIVKKQGRRRFERQHSQHKKVFGISLAVKGTFDLRILEAHSQGTDLFKSIVEGRKGHGFRMSRGPLGS